MEQQPIDRPQKGQHMMANWGGNVADGINTCASEIASLRGTGKLESRRDPLVGAIKFLFAYSYEYDADEDETTVTIGEGAVQVGGYTYFSQGGTATTVTSGTCYLCAVVALGSGTVSFKGYATPAALNTAQSDMTKYIFPLYKLLDYNVVLDYRPMPNAGCWEIAESVSNGGNAS